MIASFFFHADLVEVARNLIERHPNITYPGDNHWPLQPWISDRIWLRMVADRQLCVVMRDQRLMTRPAARKAMTRSGVRTVNITVRQSRTAAGYAALLETHWSRLEEILTEPPAYYTLTTRGVTIIEDP